MEPYRVKFNEMAMSKEAFRRRLDNDLNKLLEHVCKLKLTQKEFADKLDKGLYQFVFKYKDNWALTVQKWTGILYKDLEGKTLKASNKEKVYAEIFFDNDIDSEFEGEFSSWVVSGFSAYRKAFDAEYKLLGVVGTGSQSEWPWFQELKQVLYSFCPKGNKMLITLEEANERMADFLASDVFNSN